MTFYKLTDKKVHIVCTCGHEYSIEVKDIRASVRKIYMPKQCPKCGTRRALTCAYIGDAKDVPESIKQRHILNQTLFKRLIDNGQFAVDPVHDRKLGPDDFDDKDMHLAEEWKKGMEMTAPLHPRIANAKAEMEKTKEQVMKKEKQEARKRLEEKRQKKKAINLSKQPDLHGPGDVK